MTTQATIAHYRIASKLGAGGMGEVYRATDTKLAREVALKVIPDKFAQDTVRMSRFKREAQVLASLNHPNIAAIYGVEDRALVMELVEGETLAELISAGPIPPDEALPIARQIADALAYAHEHGIVHRDLKPANIKITPQGRVKVLDFGLAKALSSGNAGAADPGVSPTITMQTATAGIVIGTAGYMSPEQARGKVVDKRADIWAFGVVLVEMLTSRSLFAGETISDTLAAVLRSDIDYSYLPPDTPPGVRNLIERCLERDLARRLRDIGDAGILMDATPAFALAAAPAKRKKWLPWVAGLLAGAALAASIGWFLWPVYSPEPTRFDIYPNEAAIAWEPAVSPDGRSIAFVQLKSGIGLNGIGVYIRRLDRVETTLIPGSEGVNSRPFWSPDSRRLAFFVGGKLKAVMVDGGDVQTLADGLAGNAASYSGAWSSTGVILFSQLGKPIYRMPDTGGTASPVLSFDASRGEVAQLLSGFLPDGEHFLFTSGSQQGVDTYEGSLDGSKPVRVLDSAAVLGFARPPRAQTGYLLFYRNGQILLRPFDPGSARMSGNAILVESGVFNSVTFSPNANMFLATAKAGSISGRTLVYTENANVWAAPSQITWLSREGRALGSVGDPGRLGNVQISPDQRYLAFARADRGSDVWLADVRRGGTTRLTFNEGNASVPVFSPDGERIAYASERDGDYAILIRATNGSGAPEAMFKTRSQVHPASWSHNGEWLACIIGIPGNWDIDLLPIASGRKRITLTNTPFDEFQPQFSPDGRWIAYASNESGRYEVYVVNVPQAAGGAAIQGRWQISIAGGQQPRWRADGKELFFLSDKGQMMSVRVDSNANGFQASPPQSLFPTGLIPLGPKYLYDVSADGRKFAILKPVSGAAAPLKVIVNWAAAFGAH